MLDSQTIDTELSRELRSVTALVQACETLLENGFPDIVAGMRSRINLEILQSSRVLHDYCGDPMLMSKTSARRWHDQFGRVWERSRAMLEKLPGTDPPKQLKLAVAV